MLQGSLALDSRIRHLAPSRWLGTECKGEVVVLVLQ